MPSNIKSRLQKLEATLSNVAGFPIVITVRGENEFTFAIEEHGDQRPALEKVREFLSMGVTSWETNYDEELQDVYAYATLQLVKAA